MLHFAPTPNALALSLVAGGAAIGAVCRYLAGYHINALHSTPFPFGTFAVNIAGCFLMGLVAYFALPGSTDARAAAQMALGVGFLGGFTTFSAFGLEMHNLLREDRWVLLGAYITLSVLLGLLALRAGLLVAARLTGAGAQP